MELCAVSETKAWQLPDRSVRILGIVQVGGVRRALLIRVNKIIRDVLGYCEGRIEDMSDCTSVQAFSTCESPGICKAMQLPIEFCRGQPE